jgi:hypothetical protein
VPAVVARPYARVGEMRPEGKAYRAYFIADFAWAMAVAEEISKGDVPPKNRFWPGIICTTTGSPASRRPSNIAGPDDRHRAAAPHQRVAARLAFMAFFYAFVRQFVRSARAAAIGCVFAVFFTSFEGAQQLYVFWQRGVPLAGLRDLNIDGISNWKFGSLKVDGLQRLLLYQPHHATSWALSLSALLVLQQARDASRVAINLLAGVLLAVGLLVSSFIALMVGSAVALYQALGLLMQRRWRALVLGGVAAAVPVGIAVLVSNLLEYVDQTAGPIVSVGHLNRSPRRTRSRDRAQLRSDPDRRRGGRVDRRASAAHRVCRGRRARGRRIRLLLFRGRRRSPARVCRLARGPFVVHCHDAARGAVVGRRLGERWRDSRGSGRGPWDPCRGGGADDRHRPLQHAGHRESASGPRPVD